MERLTKSGTICGDKYYDTIGFGAIEQRPFFEIIKKLAYYEDLDEQKLLIKLLCKVGDTLYLLDHERTEGMKYNCEIDGIMEGYLCRSCGKYSCTLHPSIQEVEVKNITIMKDNETIIEFTDFRDVVVEDFGVKVFLTRDEAEEKLKGDGINERI